MFLRTTPIIRGLGLVLLLLPGLMISPTSSYATITGEKISDSTTTITFQFTYTGTANRLHGEAE